MAVTNFPLKTGVGASGGGGTERTLSFPTFGDFPATGEVGFWYIDEANADAYLWDGSVYELQSSSGGDVQGPASSTDNSVARFDLTTGKIIQNSSMKLLDDGTFQLNPTGSGTINVMDINNTNVQAIRFRWQPASGDAGIGFYSGSTQIARFQDNGFAYFSKFGTLGGFNIDNFFIQRGAAPRMDWGDINYGVRVSHGVASQALSEAMFKVLNNLAANHICELRGVASQSGDYLRVINSAGTVLLKIDASGDISYTAADAGDWSGSAPTTVKAALDRIAAALGPIA